MRIMRTWSASCECEVKMKLGSWNGMLGIGSGTGKLEWVKEIGT